MTNLPESVPPTSGDSPNTPNDDGFPDHQTVGKVLQRRMSHRPSVHQVELRGVVPPRYFDDPKQAYGSQTLGREVVKWSLEEYLPRRPSQTALENAGVVPPRYFENPKQNSQRMALLREAVGLHMEEFLPRRRSIVDLANNNIVPMEYLDNDPKEAEALKRERIANTANILENKLNRYRRPSIQDVSRLGYVPLDTVDPDEHRDSNMSNGFQYTHHFDQYSMESDRIIYKSIKSNKNELQEDPYSQRYVIVPEDGNTLNTAYGYNVYTYSDQSTGQVYNFGVDPYQGFVPMGLGKRRETQNELSRRLSRDHRRSIHDLEVQRILLGNYYEEDYDRNLEQQRQQKLRIKEELNQRLHPRRRPSVLDLAHLGIMDEEVLYQLYGLADEVRKKHQRMESAVQDLESHLNLPEELGHKISSEILGELNTLDPTLMVASSSIPTTLNPINEHGNHNNDNENEDDDDNEDENENDNDNETENDDDNDNTIVNPNLDITNTNDGTDSNDNENSNKIISPEVIRFQALIGELHLALEVEKEKARNYEKAYVQMQTQCQNSVNTLSTVRTKEKEYLSRIQELEQKNNAKYTELIKERDLLSNTAEQLKAQIHRQEQYYSKLETTTDRGNKNDNNNNNTNSNNNNDKDDKTQQYLNQIKEIEQQNIKLAQEKEEHRKKSANAKKELQTLTEILKRTEESKIQLIQTTVEQMDQLRSYLKSYNPVPSQKQKNI